MSDAEEHPETTGQSPAEAPGGASRLAAALIVLLIFLSPAVGFVWLRMMSRQSVEFAILCHAQNMLIRHVARTGGQWPASWDDLEADFEPADANFNTPSLAAMQALIDIDFQFDMTVLQSQEPDQLPPVIRLRDRPVTDEMVEANTRLFHALASRVRSTRVRSAS